MQNVTHVTAHAASGSSDMIDTDPGPVGRRTLPDHVYWGRFVKMREKRYLAFVISKPALRLPDLSAKVHGEL